VRREAVAKMGQEEQGSRGRTVDKKCPMQLLWRSLAAQKLKGKKWGAKLST